MKNSKRSFLFIKRFSLALITCYFLSSCHSSRQDDPLISAANRAFSEGKYDTALELYQQAAEKYPEDLESHLKIGETYIALANLQKAKQTFEQAIIYDDGNYRARRQLGRVLLMTFESQNALEQYQYILTRLPDDREALNGAAVAYDQQGQHKAGQNNYLKILESDRDNPEIKSNLGLSYLFDKNYEAALNLLEPIGLKANATKKQRHNLALAYAVANYPDKAREILKGELGDEEISDFFNLLEQGKIYE